MRFLRNISFILVVMLICGVYAPFASAQDNTGAVVLTSFDEPDRIDAVAFELGISQNTLANWLADCYCGFTGYDEQGNSYDLTSNTWFIENVDTNKKGLYYAWAIPDINDEYILGVGISLPKQLYAVSIQNSGKPDINCCVSARGFLRFPWVISSEQLKQPEQFEVWLQQDGGEWQQLSDGFIITLDELMLSQKKLEYMSNYNLQVCYSGGQTGIASFFYDDEINISDYSGGDRDGGDVKGSGPLSGTQPAPTPTPEPTKEPTPSNSNNNSSDDDNDDLIQVTDIIKTPVEQARVFVSEIKPDTLLPSVHNNVALDIQNSTETLMNSQNNLNTQKQADNNMQATVQETYSPTQTIISWLRLRNLCTDDKRVVFGGNDLTVSIPSEVLMALNLSDNDTLSVKLTQPKNNQITLEVDAAGIAITELPGTVLRLRYTPQFENAEITVYNADGIKSADAEFDGEFLRFSANTLGTYIVLEAGADLEKNNTKQNSALPLFSLIGGGVLVSATGTVFIRRKHNG